MAADLRLVSVSADLKFDKSILTGESKQIAATTESTSDNFLESCNIALQGSLCVGGSGLGIVIQTADSTVLYVNARASLLVLTQPSAAESPNCQPAMPQDSRPCNEKFFGSSSSSPAAPFRLRSS